MGPQTSGGGLEASRHPTRNKGYPVLKQIMRFGTVGVFSTVIHLVTFSALIEFLDLSGLLANFVAFSLAFMIAFIGHFHWTFSGHNDDEKAGDWRPALLRFALVALFGLLLNSTIAFLVVDYAQWSYVVAGGLMATVTPAITFWVSKVWAFKKPDRATLSS